MHVYSYKIENSMFVWEEWETAEDQAAYMAQRTEEGLIKKMVRPTRTAARPASHVVGLCEARCSPAVWSIVLQMEDGVVSAEVPPVITVLTHVSTYKDEPKPVEEPIVEDANPAAEAAAEPEPAGELGAPPAMEAPKPAEPEPAA